MKKPGYIVDMCGEVYIRGECVRRGLRQSSGFGWGRLIECGVDPNSELWMLLYTGWRSDGVHGCGRVGGIHVRAPRTSVLNSGTEFMRATHYNYMVDPATIE